MSQITRLNIEQFRALLAHTQLNRQITSVHLHHTWRPRQDQFVGQRTVEGMRNFHLSLGWSDIAQHLTIAPDGGLWTGRNWNWQPVSAKGHNGSRQAGPFMIEIVGDFDEGQDVLEGAQRDAVVEVVARLLARYDIGPEGLRFHNEFVSYKTCPGTSLDLDSMRQEVATCMESLVATCMEPLQEDEEPTSRSFLSRSSLLGEYLASSDFVAPVPAPVEIDGELPESDFTASEEFHADVPALAPSSGATSRGVRFDLNPGNLAELRKHVINLSHGRLSDEGVFSNTAVDLEAIFFEHLPEWRRTHVESGKPTKIVVFAHGGLVGEKKGLRIVLRDRIWWMANGVYPLFLVWETGWREILQQQATASRSFGQERGVTGVTDWVLEKSLRPLGRSLWSGMKESALFASLEDLGDGEPGGTFQLAQQLRSYATHLENDGGLEIHAVGHSAGSIIHAHFLDLLIGLGLKVKSLHFLAPAIRVDLFKEKLLSHIVDKSVEEMALYTMNRVLEEADNVIKIYRKSLLYFVSRACEPARKTPILGLEVSVRKDEDLKQLFGIDGRSSPAADVIWSQTDADTSPRSASQATTHGGFDDDSATMNSVLRRILRIGDAESLPLRHLPSRSLRDDGAGSTPEFGSLLVSPEDFLMPEPTVQPSPFAAGPPSPSSSENMIESILLGTNSEGNLKHRALCVGINHYASAPLQGCVRDSKIWGAVLEGLGFDVSYLHNEQATWRKTLETLHRMIIDSKPGEEIVFQFAGHGTQLDDLSHDEDDLLDEALVPFDYTQGPMILDDDLGTLYNLVPDGVGLTIFMDCCNSGSNNRAAPVLTFREPGLRARYLPATTEMESRHRSFRAAGNILVGSRSSEGPAGKETHFAACQDHELAYENHGQGDFTRHAASFLADAVRDGLDAEAFLNSIRQRFGSQPRQNPRLIARSVQASRPLLAGLKL